MPIRDLPGSKKTGRTVTLSTILAAGGNPDPNRSGESSDLSPENLIFLTESPTYLKQGSEEIEKDEFIDLADLLLKKQGVEEQSYTKLAKEKIIMVTELRHPKSQKSYTRHIDMGHIAFLTFTAIERLHICQKTGHTHLHGKTCIVCTYNCTAPGRNGTAVLPVLAVQRVLQA